ncbi:MAG: NifB/NifX family molybdenum-iron cluster-binding protein [Candidatus Omnitrophica bacterium]|jgi:predicted Fe-Mo cluster-binding NifX family protein|nr:NifB/NifX family molybdenum-iron cluster-binding protein [Candidatus Omnitrophota bacterium]MDD5078502.1 NifB/NifX family molybdenum-iron cluster-binding protein [Candidatus Omnitrophota bacterium]MDD5725276.1 NifB/NifX family molybdenum-iron cluster-binding protein [Candidatus Omnitrophota bacterium]
MKVGVVLENENGLDGNVCAHFGQCRFFLLADIDKESKKITGTRVVPNTAVHGGGGCTAVDEILQYGITHIIAGGMGMGAQAKLAQAGVEVFGYSGSVRKGLEELMNNALGGLEGCKGHQEGEGCH